MKDAVENFKLNKLCFSRNQHNELVLLFDAFEFMIDP